MNYKSAYCSVISNPFCALYKPPSEKDIVIINLLLRIKLTAYIIEDVCFYYVESDIRRTR